MVLSSLAHCANLFWKDNSLIYENSLFFVLFAFFTNKFTLGRYLMLSEGRYFTRKFIFLHFYIQRTNHMLTEG